MTDFLEKISLVIFDFDGVIVQTAEIKHNSFLATAESLDQSLIDDLDRALKTKLVGAERSEVGRWFCLKSNKNINAHQFTDTFAKKLIENRESIYLTEGFRVFLDNLIMSNIPAAIVSNAPFRDIINILEKVSIPADSFVDISGYDCSKNKAKRTRELLYTIGCGANEMVFFGDMPSDLRACDEVGGCFIRIKSYIGVQCEWKKNTFVYLDNFIDIPTPNKLFNTICHFQT